MSITKDQKLEAKYGLFTAISMVIGQVIGSGIFFKVDDVLSATQGNILAGLLGFLIVGISVVFAGISLANYAELLPREGGILSYVNYRFGETASYFVGWMYMSLFYPLLTAVLFTVSGIYIAHLFAEFMNFTPTNLHYSLIGFVNLLLFFSLNILHPKSSGIFQQMTTVLKVLPLIFIASLGILSIFKGDVNEVNTFSQLGNGVQTQSFWLLVAASFIPISFAFDGWYIATQISGEIKNSSKNLPKALIIGTISVMVIYIAYYLGVVFRMSGEEIIQLKNTYITEFARKFASDSGALLMQLFIIISVLGTSNGLLLASIRVPYQFVNLKKSKNFLKLDRVNKKTKMPLNSGVFSVGAIIFYLGVYYLTSTLPFFSEKNFDLSAIPIIFIYMVNGALFLGLFKLINKNLFQGKSLLKKIMSVIAVLGNGIVLFGSASAANGLTYFVVNIIFILAGYLLMKKT